MACHHLKIVFVVTNTVFLQTAVKQAADLQKLYPDAHVRVRVEM